MSISEDHLARTLARERDRLTAWIWAIVRDHDVADDVYQDLCVAAVQHRRSIADDAHLHNWLRTTARHRAIDAIRARRTSPLVFRDGVLDLIEHEWAAADPDDDAARTRALRCCMGELTDTNRELLRLRYVENVKGNRLAQRVGRKPNAVFVMLSRVHRALARCIEQRLADGRGAADV